MITPTLKQRVTQISLGAFFATSAVLLAGFIIFSIAKRDLAQKEIERDLKRNATQQIEQLIPSFLLPEQTDGVKLLLDRIVQSDELSHALIISSASQMPDGFSDCRVSAESSSTCFSEDGKETALVVPITEASQKFGFFVKTKHNTSAFAANDILQLAGLIAFMLGITFVGIYIFIARVLSKTLPKALDRLVEWIEADLSDRPANISTLPFAELEALHKKISEVMKRHSEAREQAVIGQLTSGIMHDIRTPLHSIVSALYLVEKYPAGNPKRIVALEELARSCRDHVPLIGEIIETTLDGGRKIHVDRKEQDLVATVREALELCEKMRGLRNVEVSLDLPESLYVSHDRVQLGRVLHNLIKNAIEAASEASQNRSVHISIKNLEAVGVEVVVDDSGTGIVGSPDRLFRAFQSTKTRGTGLGLLVSQRIAEAHFGKITASNRSKVGGARFSVTLPSQTSEASI
jgi:signal transduction histidine kinase